MFPRVPILTEHLIDNNPRQHVILPEPLVMLDGYVGQDLALQGAMEGEVEDVHDVIVLKGVSGGEVL